MTCRIRLLIYIILISVTGCIARPAQPPASAYSQFAATSQPVGSMSVALDASLVAPMHHESLAIDLPTVLQVAAAANLDIKTARQFVEQSRGNLESTVGSVFPGITPNAAFDGAQGTVRDIQGRLVPANFNTFQLFGVAQWIINPGQVTYQLIAAKKRLYASEEQERAVVLDTLRVA